MNSAWQVTGRLVAKLGMGCRTLHRPLAASPKMIYHTQKANMLTSIDGKRLRSTCASKFEVINVQDEEDFKRRVLDASSSAPIVIDFHATWCGPCKLLGPRLESILAEENGKVVMAKVDIDDNSELAMKYGVRSVPTVIGMKNGRVQNQFIGLIDDDQIRSFIDKLVIS
uniref:Thioredoxin domain-containing protein n=1 Tax=Arion vulgaris TaxID=1028688 RepID=A0A0B6ZRM6_9EUPU